MNHNDVVSYIEKLPYASFQKIINHYTKNHKVTFDNELNELTMNDFQKRLEALGINTSCPVCKSSKVVKNGTRKHTQRYRCKLCNTL